MYRLNKTEIISIAAVAAVYLVIIITFSHGFWVIDEGNKFIWAQNLIDEGSLELKDRAADISPDNSAFKRPFSVASDGGRRQMTTFSPLFIILTAPLAALGGMKLALLLPMVAALGLIIAVRHTAHLLGFPFTPLAILLLGLASPLLFYSVTLWEHGLSILLGVAALNCSMSALGGISRKLLSGALFALSVYLRPEMAVFALGVWIFICRERGWILIGGLMGAALIAGFNWSLTGSAVPLQISTNYALKWGDIGAAGLVMSRLDSFYALLLEGGHLWYMSVILIAAAAAYFFLPGILKFLFPLLSIVLVFLSFFDSTPFYNLIHRNSLLYCAPLYFAALSFKADTAVQRSFKRLIYFTALVIPLLAPVFGGIHFGPRLLLPLIPLLGIAAAAYIQRETRSGNVFRADAVWGLVLAQALVTIWGLSLLEGRRNANSIRAEVILEKSENTIITLQWWLQQEIPELYQTRDFYLVDSPFRLKKMLIDYYIGGVRFFTLLLHDRSGLANAEGISAPPDRVVSGGNNRELRQILGESDVKLLEMFNRAPPKQIGNFIVNTPYPSMNLIGLRYALGFDVKGAAKLADELAVYLGQVGRLCESEKYLRYAVSWDSRVGKYHYNLAYNLGKQGRYTEALKELETAHRLDPKSEVIAKMLGELREKIDSQ